MKKFDKLFNTIMEEVNTSKNHVIKENNDSKKEYKPTKEQMDDLWNHISFPIDVNDRKREQIKKTMIKQFSKKTFKTKTEFTKAFRKEAKENVGLFSGR